MSHVNHTQPSRCVLSRGAACPVLLALAICSAAVPAPLWAQSNWWNKDWRFRRLVNARQKKSGLEGSEAAWVTIPTHGLLASDARDLRVVTPGGAVLPHYLMRIGPGDQVTVAFPLRPAYAAYHIYYGNKAAEKPPRKWRPKRGVLLESWTYRGGRVNTLDQVKRTFTRAAGEYEGAAFVPNIFVGLNPISGSSRWCHKFTAYLIAPKSGAYKIATTSAGASFVLIDDKLVVGWGGRHGFRGDTKHNAAVNLKAGSHKLTYYLISSGWQGGAVAAWKPPGAEDFEVIPPTAFARVKQARLGRLEAASQSDSADFTFENAGETFLTNRYLHRFRFQPGPGLRSAGGVKYRWELGDGTVYNKRRVEHVYLTPGLYSVKLTLFRGGRSTSITNRVRIDRDWAATYKRDLDATDDYRAMVAEYDFSRMPGNLIWHAVSLLERGGKFRKAFASALTALAAKTVDLRREQVATVIAWVRRDKLVGRKSPEQAAQMLLQMERNAGRPDVAIQFGTAAGRVLLDESVDLPRARELFERLVREYADRVRSDTARAAHIGLGDVYRLDGDYDRAEQAYIAAGDKSDPAANSSAGGTSDAGPAGNAGLATIRVAHLSRSVEHFTKQGRYDVAEKMLDEWENDFPRQRLNGLSTLARMRLLAAQGDTDAAIQRGSELLAVNENSLYAAEILFEQAQLHRRTARDPQALAALRELLDRHPESAIAKAARTMAESISP